MTCFALPAKCVFLAACGFREPADSADAAQAFEQSDPESPSTPTSPNNPSPVPARDISSRREIGGKASIAVFNLLESSITRPRISWWSVYRELSARVPWPRLCVAMSFGHAHPKRWAWHPRVDGFLHKTFNPQTGTRSTRAALVRTAPRG